MKKLLLSILGIHLLFVSNAQLDGSIYTAMGRGGVGTTMTTDYQCIGVNPANLGLKTKYETKHVTLGFLEGGVGTFAQGITRTQLDRYIVDPIKNNQSLNPFLNPSDAANATDLLKGNTFSTNIEVMILGIAIQTEKLGGLGLKITEHASSYSVYTQAFTNFAFYGATSTMYFDSLRLNNGDMVVNDPNMYPNYYLTNFNYNNQSPEVFTGVSSKPLTFGHILDGTKTQHHYYRSIDIAYGKKIWGDEIFEIHGGVTLKYLMGYNYMDISAQNGVLTGLVAISPSFANDYTDAVNIPTTQNKGNFFTPSGQGVGADVGITGVYKETLKFGVSVLNIGSITYNNNAVSLSDTVFNELEYKRDALDNLNQLIYWDPVSSFKVKLPTMVRFGGSIALMENKLEIGADVIIPLNKAAGNLQYNYYALGGDYYLARWFKVSTGVNMGGNYANSLYNYKSTVNVPFGFTFILGENGGWEVGVATRDIQSLVMPNSKGVNTSIGLGFLRFRL